MVVSTDLTHVLVVDDSVVTRQALVKLLTEAGGFEVVVASDAFFALRRIALSRPDVVVLDLQMPGMDGLTLLHKIMEEDPLPVVICSAFSGTAAGAAIDALEAGAVAVVKKPMADRGSFGDSGMAIVDAVRGAAPARLRARGRRPAGAPRPLDVVRPLPQIASSGAAARAGGEPMVVAAGASTGGTEALQHVLRAMPANAPGFVIVQHMPEGFTRAFAERLDELCAMEVREAHDGDRIHEGLALIAPGNRHLRLYGRPESGFHVGVSDGPLVSRHRPSVDVLFQSCAENAGVHALGVILTGMGADGAEGLLAMRRAGALTLAQDEATSVVFGMPKEAISRGAAQEVLPLSSLPAVILSHRPSKHPAKA